MTEQKTITSLPACDLGLRTDPGRDPDKQVNEDSAIYVETPLGLLAVVCDGMGGHAGGKEASELAVETIVAEVQGATPEEPRGDVLRRALTEANARIWNMSTSEAGLRPGSTVVVALVHAGGAEIAHVGDSRIYLAHAGAITQITRDHSMVQELVDRNLIKAEDAQKHPDANKILRALGISKDVEVDVRPLPVPFVAGDVFVLCSDGLSDLVSPAEILEIVTAHAPPQAAGRLVDLANARGGHDNITVLVLATRETAASLPAPTIVKTVPIAVPTEHAAPGGQGATLLGVPMPGVTSGGGVPPAQVPPASLARPAPPAADHDHQEGPRRSRGPALVALAAAVIALAVLALFQMNRRTHHKTVPLVVDPLAEAAAPASPEPTEVDDEPPVVEVAPPLPEPPPLPTAGEAGAIERRPRPRGTAAPAPESTY